MLFLLVVLKKSSVSTIFRFLQKNNFLIHDEVSIYIHQKRSVGGNILKFENMSTKSGGGGGMSYKFFNVLFFHNNGRNFKKLVKITFSLPDISL